MCLIVFAYNIHPGYKLIVGANRDEFFDRPAMPIGFWEEAPDLLAGKDLKQGGTWLGITRGSRFAALTNYRAPKSNDPNKTSRGHLVRDYLQGNASPAEFKATLAKSAADFNGFNLLFGDFSTLYYFSNRTGETVKLTPGLYGLSNSALDVPWPKVVKTKEALAGHLAGADSPSHREIFRILNDSTPAPDSELPDTGVGLELERYLSPVFISGDKYGTRSSSVLLADNQNHVTFYEKTFDADRSLRETVSFRFRIKSRGE